VCISSNRLWMILILVISSVMKTSVGEVVPVVGVLSQPRFKNATGEVAEYYIAASYIKWLESAGARSIPIPYDAPQNLVDDLFGQVQGILFPGGGSDVPPAAQRLWDLAQEANLREPGSMPVWGTCLGFEYLVILSSDQGSSIMERGFDAENISLPLHFVDHLPESKSRLYPTTRIREIAATEAVAMNNHQQGIEPSAFYADGGLTETFFISTTNMDRVGREFVSSIESLDPDRFPYFGVQFHPEKNPFEYATYPSTDIPFEHINHSPTAIEFSLSLAQLFVHLVRSASQSSNDPHIYNKPDLYPPVYKYPIKVGLSFQEKHIIPGASHWDGTFQGLRTNRETKRLQK